MLVCRLCAFESVSLLPAGRGERFDGCCAWESFVGEVWRERGSLASGANLAKIGVEEVDEFKVSFHRSKSMGEKPNLSLKLSGE